MRIGISVVNVMLSNGFIVTVKNELGAVEKAHITYNAEIKNEDGAVNTAENISVILPENVKFDYAKVDVSNHSFPHIMLTGVYLSP